MFQVFSFIKANLVPKDLGQKQPNRTLINPDLSIYEHFCLIFGSLNQTHYLLCSDMLLPCNALFTGTAKYC